MIHPLHVALLAGMWPLAVAALLADWAYAETRHVQWVNFASWLIAGTALLSGLALLWTVGAALFGRAGGRSLLLVLLVLGTFGMAVLGALVHTRDGWGAMPEAVVLSGLVALLALAAIWAGLARGAGGR